MGIKKAPKITVIVPIYKVEDFIHTCIKSLIDQSCTELEILLIDDGSPDLCPSLCDEYCKSDGRIRVIHKENGGLASARNRGLDEATGDYISFLDGDDWLEPETLSEMLKMMMEYQLDIVCCSGKKVYPDGRTEKCFEAFPTDTIKSGKEVAKRILLDEIGSQVVQGLYKKKCWDGVRFPLGRLYEDIPTTFKAFWNAENVGYIDKEFYQYRMNENGISFSKNPLKPYHIYLGFREHYEFSLQNNLSISGRCCALAGHYGISTLYNYYISPNETIAPQLGSVGSFLNEHITEIKENIVMMPKTRRYALFVFWKYPKVFKVFCEIIHFFKKIGGKA